jgi:DnaK suppressor protein|tara:strand:- start:521 stop:1021 length:501 start_codon:yes stop_codon:yes gene_type:complete
MTINLTKKTTKQTVKKNLKKPLVTIVKKLSSNGKNYIPNAKEKYMCAKHKQFFKQELLRWKNDIIKSNSLTNLLNSSDDSVSSADMVDQASSYTDKSVEMKALARSRKLIEKIEAALRRIQDGTYGYCEETSEPIGLKRLIARPVATLSIEAQERHERDEKIFTDD